ncbi:ubiquitin C-terminal hydrolase 15-like [Musa acuminata AAA Group]|uniref:ubiquitin C-terminal hydrolase 15-like n=1 Tax=Musa acuminata AAA Group TaxID=214697 RepID=UPI0031DC5D07
MLLPREADIPALFIFLVVLPLITYVLLGIWNESAKKKARIGLLAQLAAEEACQAEATTTAHVPLILPSSRSIFHECSRCSAPATTRCSRCKSVRYCSGKCQIIHWRQGHKHECRQWSDNSLNVTASLPLNVTVQHKPLIDNIKSPFLGNGVEESIRCNIHYTMDDPSSMIINTSQNSETGRKPSEKLVLNKLGGANLNDNDSATCVCDEDSSYGFSVQASLTSYRNVIPSVDAPVVHKLASGNLTASSGQVHSNQETNSSSNSRNVMFYHDTSADETRRGLEQNGSSVLSSPFHLDQDVITECQNGGNISSAKVDTYGAELSSATEAAHVRYPDEHSAKQSIMYRKPPYTLGHSSFLSQNLAENGSRENHSQGLERKSDEERGTTIPQKNLSSNIHLQDLNKNPSIEGRLTSSKKISKVIKWNLVGLRNDNKKTKVCQVLFPYEDVVKFFQCEEEYIYPRGLFNCGNSCYANAVLQCLTGTKPLRIYLLRRLHSKSCRVKEWCLICELEQYVSMLREGGGPLSPSRILSNMKNIGCRMGGGDQEDAHEFLRLLVMSMQSVFLEGMGGEKEVDPRLQDTTLIQQIFGGRLKSKVKCLRCHIESERYESIMDLTLEIHGWVESLEDALTQFTAPEDLDGDNMYRCGRCSAYVKARKQLSVHEVPNILTIVLKRFQTGKYGKINKCVTFPDMLDMIPFVTGTVDNPPIYLLYAVVVHLDAQNASFSGHYISYIKDLEGTWFRIDDSQVQAVTLSQVMSEGAYMLFYSRSFPRPPRGYAEKRLSRPPTSIPKSQKTSKHVQQRRNETLFARENSSHQRNGFGKENEDLTEDADEFFPRPTSRNFLPNGRYPDTSGTEFSEATSSDWTFFTSSDDSSFTTEGTRDSFSMTDYGDNTSLDGTISSLFGTFYEQEHVDGNNISWAKFTPSRLQRRFFPESTGCVMDRSMLP